MPVQLLLAASSAFQYRVCCAAAVGFLHFPTSGGPPYLLAVAAQALPSNFFSAGVVLNLV